MSFITALFAKIGAFFMAILLALGLAGAAPAPSPSASATTSDASVSAQIANQLGLPQGVGITNLVAWKQFSDPSWALSFPIESTWTVTPIKDSTGKLSQVSMSGTDSGVFVSKGINVTTGNYASTMSTRVIDGQTVSVKTYAHPVSDTAFYKLFKLTAADGDYYFFWKSGTTSTATFENFLSQIKGAK